MSEIILKIRLDSETEKKLKICQEEYGLDIEKLINDFANTKIETDPANTKKYKRIIYRDKESKFFYTY